MAINDRIFSMTRRKKKLKDKTISFYGKTTGRDPVTGMPVETESVVNGLGDIKAYVRQIGARDMDSDISLIEPIHETTYLFMVNYRENLQNDYKIEYKDDMYEIKQIDYFEGYKKDIVITATMII